MNDLEIEERLRQYRPVGPPSELRARILEAAPLQRIWPWAAAAAGLLLTTLGLHTAAESKTTRADVRPGPASSARVAEDLINRLGDDPGARDLAAFILAEQQIRTEASPSLSTGPDAHRTGSQR